MDETRDPKSESPAPSAASSKGAAPTPEGALASKQQGTGAKSETDKGTKPPSPKRLRERFTDGVSLRLFTEALEQFQSYNRAPDAKKLDAASERLEICRHQYPEDLLPLFYLGLVRVEQSYAGLSEALEIFEDIIERGDDDLRSDAMFNLGIANIELYGSRGDQAAREWLRKARDAISDKSTPHDHAVQLHAEILLAYLDVWSVWRSWNKAEETARSRRDEIVLFSEEEKKTLEAAESELSRLKARLADLGESAGSYVRAEFWNTMGLAAECRAMAAASRDERLQHAKEADERLQHAKEADEQFKQALRYRRDWIPSLSNRAALYQHRFEDRGEDALTLWQRVLQIRPDDEYAHYNLGRYYEKSDRKRARKYYEKAPHIKEARAALAKLAKGRWWFLG